MPQRRPWFETFINRLFQSGEPEAELDRMAAKTENTEDVFGLGVSETELRDAISAMRDDLSSLSGDIRRHLQHYQEYLQASIDATGIDATDLEMDAQAELSDAKDKHAEYNSLASKYQVLRRALKKWQRSQRRKQRQREYAVDLGELDVDEARRKIEALEEEGQIEQQNADRLRRQLDMLGDSAEPDLDDVEKDLAELEKDQLEQERNDKWDLSATSETEDEGVEEDIEDDPITMDDLEKL